MNGPELLIEWRKSRQKTQAAAGKELGIDQAAVSDYERRRRTPTIRIALRIERASGGAIPVASWAQEAV